jgi:hypothetical protein
LEEGVEARFKGPRFGLEVGEEVEGVVDGGEEGAEAAWACYESVDRERKVSMECQMFMCMREIVSRNGRSRFKTYLFSRRMTRSVLANRPLTFGWIDFSDMSMVIGWPLIRQRLSDYYGPAESRSGALRKGCISKRSRRDGGFEIKE